jgi:two-component system, sensor histidine kinase LadS
MLRLLAFLILANLTLFASGAMAAPLAVNEERRELNGGEVAFLRDPEGRYDITEVSAPTMSEKFQPLARGLSFGYTTDVIWLRITLQRASAAPSVWRLEVTNSYINDLRFYAPSQNGFAVAQAGDRFPYAERPFSFYNPVFAVDLPDSAPRSFYLRLYTDSSTSAGLLLWQPAALREAGQTALLLLGSVMGMILMSLIFSLLNFAFTRNRRLLSFAAMTAVIILMLPAQLGLLAQFALPHTPLLADLLVPWCLAITIASLILTFRQPLDIPQNHPRLDRILQVAVLISLLAPLTREFNLYSQIGGPLLQVLFMGALVINSGVAWQRWRKKLDGAAYLFAAHAVFFSSLLIGRLVWIGLLPAAPWMFTSWVPGLLAFLVLAQVGIIVELRTSNRARHTAENAAQLAIRQADQEKQLREEQTVFFSFVAHELRSPLGVIVAGLKNLGSELVQPSSATKTRLERLNRATQRMALLVDRHLELQPLPCWQRRKRTTKRNAPNCSPSLLSACARSPPG